MDMVSLRTDGPSLRVVQSTDTGDHPDRFI